jgi:hypothetical protein
MLKVADRFEDLGIIEGFFNKTEFLAVCAAADAIFGLFRCEDFISHVTLSTSGFISHVNLSSPFIIP